MVFDDDVALVASGIENEVDALCAVGCGANVVGFDFYPSPQQIGPKDADDIIRRLPAGVAAMGSFRSEMPERVCDVANRLGLHVVELRGAFSPSQQAYIADRVRVVVRSVTWERLDLSPVAEMVKFISLPEEDDFDLWRACDESLDDVSARHVLARGLGPGTVAAALRHRPLGGVIAGSSVRTNTGTFDVLKATEYFKQAREALDNPWSVG